MAGQRLSTFKTASVSYVFYCSLSSFVSFFDTNPFRLFGDAERRRRVDTPARLFAQAASNDG